MTTHELLRFSGSILGPALVAEAVADLLRAIPAPTADPRASQQVDRLLRQALPDGLNL